MAKTNLNYNNTGFRVCADAVSEGRISGRIFSMRLCEPVSFSDLKDFILKVEIILNTQSFPQAFQRRRLFRERISVTPRHLRPDMPRLDETTVSMAAGAIATFSVRIISRRNTTWQGELDYLDGTHKKRFESELQFIAMVGDLVKKETYYTYADYYARDKDDTVPVHVLEGCSINLPEVFSEEWKE